MEKLALKIPGFSEGITPPPNVPTGGLFIEGQHAIRSALSFFLIIILLLAFLYAFIGAIRYIFARGDKQKIQSAREKITYAVVGLIIAFLAFVLMGIFSQFLNVPLISTIGPSACGGSGQKCCAGLDCKPGLFCNPADGFCDPLPTPTPTPTPIPAPVAPLITVTSVGGDTTSPYATSDTTPAFVFSTDDAALCRISTTDTNFSSMLWGCSGDGTLFHTCTAPTTFSAGSSFTMFASCKYSFGSGAENDSSNNANIPFTVLAGPTPTPTVALTPTSTPTPTVISVPTLTPTLTPTPMPTSTPTPTPTITPTPFPTPTPAPYVVGGFVWKDLDGNGAIDSPGEPRVGGATVKILLPDFSLYASGVTEFTLGQYLIGVVSGPGDSIKEYIASLTLGSGVTFGYKMSPLSGSNEKTVSVPPSASANFGLVPIITGTILINAGAATTTSTSVTLTLTCSSIEGCAEMRIANTLADLSSAPVEGFVTTRDWNLSPGAGIKAVFVQFRALGWILWSPPGGFADTIELL